MARLQVSEITVDALPDACRACLFWEAGEKPGTELGRAARASARVSKESWWQATALEWGPCGIGAWRGDRLLGYTTVAPATYLEGAARLGRVTDDALLLAPLWLDAEGDRQQVARWLVESGLRLVAARGARALEAFASPSGRQPCLPEEAILRECGFTFLRFGAPYPLYRLDLGQTARWREGVEEALVGVRRVLRGRKLGRVPSMPSVVPMREDEDQEARAIGAVPKKSARAVERACASRSCSDGEVSLA